MDMNNRSLEFLWNIIVLYWIIKDIGKARSMAKKFYDKEIEIPYEIEVLLVEFSLENRDSSAEDLTLFLTRNRCFPVNVHVIMTSLLMKQGLINASEAASLLNGLSAEHFDSDIANKVSHAIDVAWSVNEDIKDKIMKADDDDLLQKALDEVLIAVDTQVGLNKIPRVS